jgi:hypothetical protein
MAKREKEAFWGGKSGRRIEKRGKSEKFFSKD